MSKIELGGDDLFLSIETSINDCFERVVLYDEDHRVTISREDWDNILEAYKELNSKEKQ